jgi:hypothetical protein
MMDVVAEGPDGKLGERAHQPSKPTFQAWRSGTSQRLF